MSTKFIRWLCSWCYHQPSILLCTYLQELRVLLSDEKIDCAEKHIQKSLVEYSNRHALRTENKPFNPGSIIICMSVCIRMCIMYTFKLFWVLCMNIFLENISMFVKTHLLKMFRYSLHLRTSVIGLFFSFIYLCFNFIYLFFILTKTDEFRFHQTSCGNHILNFDVTVV